MPSFASGSLKPHIGASFLILLILWFKTGDITPPIPPERPEMTILEVVKINRDTLSREPKWLPDDEIYQKSLYQYGVPGGYRELINKKVGNNIMISDLLGYLAMSLPDPITFFEIGISTGRTMYQMMNLLPSDAILAGLDFENINPPFAEMLTDKTQVVKWTGKVGKRQGINCGVDKYKTPKGQTFYYVTADTEDELGWENLAKQGFKYNLIYGDSGSDSRAVMSEWGHLLRNKLGPCFTQDPWFLVLDDMYEPEHDMNKKALEMKTECEARSPHPVFIKFFPIYGWVGEHDGKHKVAVLANVDLSFLPDEKGYPDL